MSKIYQPIVIKKTEEIMQILFETNFFEESNIDDTEFANTYFCTLFDALEVPFNIAS
jgi:hypothetical protein